MKKNEHLLCFSKLKRDLKTPLLSLLELYFVLGLLGSPGTTWKSQCTTHALSHILKLHRFSCFKQICKKTIYVLLKADEIS